MCQTARLPPRPGRCVRVKFQSGEQKVADVMKFRRHEAELCDAALCKTIKSGMTFWLHPQRIHANNDPDIYEWEHLEEPEQKVDLQGEEVRRLQGALSSDGRLGRIPGGRVNEYPLFVTAPSQYIVRVARNLAEGAPSMTLSTEEDVGRVLSQTQELEKIIDSAAKEVMKSFRKRKVPEGVTLDVLQRQGKTRDRFLTAVQGRRAPLKRLEQGKEYKCYAKFECNECKSDEFKHRWDSTMAWAICDETYGRDCDCPDERRDIVGCIHQFRGLDWEARGSAGSTRPSQNCKNCSSPNYSRFQTIAGGKRCCNAEYVRVHTHHGLLYAWRKAFRQNGAIGPEL